MRHTACCLLLLLCACAAEPPGRATDAIELDRADLLLDPAAAPPEGGAWEPVSLPDRWRERRTDAGGPAWYRLEVPRPAAPAGTWAVYLPHVNMNAAVWINGVSLGASGARFSEPVANDFNRPLYFPFPASLLDRPANVLYVRLFAYAQHYGELDPLWVGPDDELRPRYDDAYLQRITLAEIATALCLVIVLFSGSLWLGSRRDPVYGWLAVVTALWGIASFNYWLRHLPVPHWTWERIIHPAIDGFMLALAVWAHRYAGVVRPRLELLFASAAALSLAVAWLLPVTRIYPAVNVLHALVFPAAAYAMVLILMQVRRSGPTEAIVYLASAAAASAFALHDLAVQFGGTSPGAPFLLPYIVPLMLLSFGSTLVVRYVSALRNAETLNRELEQRVVEKHRELEHSYEERRSLERAKLLAQERERLVRDMHDGLGGQLVSLLSLVEADRASDPRVAPAVRAALADMRLVIDSLDPALQTLGGALGAARSRFAPLLANSGVRLEWQAGDLPRTPWLGPQDYLHVLRIVQEAIANAVRHAGARRVAIRTGQRLDSGGRPGLFIEVCDDGCGIDPARAEKPSSRGLRNMQERAARLGGTLRVEPASPDAREVGTRVELWLPAAPPVGAPTPRA